MKRKNGAKLNQQKDKPGISQNSKGTYDIGPQHSLARNRIPPTIPFKDVFSNTETQQI